MARGFAIGGRSKYLEAHIRGMRELKSQFQRLPQVVKDETNEATQWAVEAGAALAQQQLRASPSIHTGNLHNHVMSRMNRKAGRGSFGIARAMTSFSSGGGKRVRVKGIVKASSRAKKGYTVDQPSRRAHFVEFGTVRHRAEPFMVPATNRVRPLYLARMRGVGRDVETSMNVTQQYFGGTGL